MHGKAEHDYQSLKTKIVGYYDAKLNDCGTTAQGVDWNSEASQLLRFEQLLKLCDRNAPFTLNDYGCGYGALLDFMRTRGYVGHYRGFDISANMIARAQQIHRGFPNCTFFSAENGLSEADYTVASGIFNVKLEADIDEWQRYITATMNTMDRLSRAGFAFNILTSYADVEYMRPHLYYADPLYWFDHCKKNYSNLVALLHDYPLYEFTILVRKT